MGKQILMNAFDMNCAMHNSHGLWKHPDNQRHRYKDLEYWVDIAQLLERGKFDALFLADVAGIYDVYRQSGAPAIRDGVQVPLNDPALIVPAMALVTKHLSFAVTVTTTYEHPYAHARRFSTLDHLTQGRLAWNIVTSYLPNAAKNYGLDEMIKHDERYELADEFLQVVYKLWEGSWDEDAVVRDVDRNIYTDPNKVRKIHHAGTYFKVPGPHLSEPSPQRTPVIYQAGSSERGRAFAAKHAECVFVGGQTPEALRFYVEDIRNQAEKLGRDPQSIKMFTGLNVIVAETKEEAQLKFEQYASLWSREAALAQFAGSSGYDLSAYDPDSYLEYKNTNHGQTRAAQFTTFAPKKLTVKEVMDRIGTLGGQGWVFAGTPQEVADHMQEKMELTGIDGFNLAHLITPGSLREFIDLVVPELQRRGIYKLDYEEGTLREKLFGQGNKRLPDHHPAAQYRNKDAYPTPIFNADQFTGDIHP
ncbi:LLM class flavin-dependent oxidoreductase [Paenibacillus naphthalenovorans]|uniref:LLM class flavin-dependent oxidoreductase n=1 Tax=Paenibacillus naphthalenovorans TaxID=162209 RepID=UPI0010B78A8F|nr:LLM class flavin-dependent oxidoreductase [Paenibacillus naphthalenovorans]GCL73187.1 FMN-dependent monooxygenase [Paenibacillus naphthalenovorans]